MASVVSPRRRPRGFLCRLLLVADAINVCGGCRQYRVDVGPRNDNGYREEHALGPEPQRPVRNRSDGR